jgi:hypothetical protein
MSTKQRDKLSFPGMIDNALKIMANEVNKYLVRKLDPDRDPTSTKRVATGNVTKVLEPDSAGSRSDALAAPGILTLCNLEEERIAKSPNNFRSRKRQSGIPQP